MNFNGTSEGFFKPFSDPVVIRKKARFRKRDCQVRYINWGSSSYIVNRIRLYWRSPKGYGVRQSQRVRRHGNYFVFAVTTEPEILRRARELEDRGNLSQKFFKEKTLQY